MVVEQFRSFFKVYLPSRSSHQLRLPPAFVKHFNEEFRKKATLKDTNGNLWHMDVEEDEHGVVSLKHGWGRFVMNHSLEYGDFLVFRYNGNSLFDVKVYGGNGCIKNQDLANSCSDKELKMIPTPMKFEYELNEEQSGPKTICSCKRKSVEESSRLSRKSKGSFDANYRKSQKCAMTTNPHFVVSVRPSRRYCLEIPNKMVRKNCLELDPKMVFRTQDGNWPVTVIRRGDGRYAFTAGVKEFWKGNSIGPEDECRFEFVFRKNRTLSKEILVSILRVSNKK